MKRLFISLSLLISLLMFGCGNAEIDKIDKMVQEATTKTKAAATLDEVAEIAKNLQKEMEKIEAEAGEKITFGKDVTESLEAYQKAAAEKLKEFNVELK